MPFRDPKTVLVLTGCGAWLAGLGWIDRATGYELGLFAFYTAPVAVVAWCFGRGPGIFVAFLASAIWFLADSYAGNHYSTAFYAYWNTGMHFTTFLINAVTFAKIRSGLKRRQELERAVEISRKQIQQLTERLSRQQQACESHRLLPPSRKAEVLPAALAPKVLPLGLGMALLLATPAGAEDTLTWTTNHSRVTADIQATNLLTVLQQVASTTGWQVFVEPQAGTRTVSAKFKELPPGEALRLLVGDLNYALIPGTNSSFRLFVFSTIQSAATQPVHPVGRGRRAEPTTTPRRVHRPSQTQP